MVYDFEESERWPRGANASFIPLVPKVKNPQILNDFRPISLVGFLGQNSDENHVLEVKEGATQSYRC